MKKTNVFYRVPAENVENLIATIIKANIALQNYNNLKLPEEIVAGYYSSNSNLNYALTTRLARLIALGLSLKITANIAVKENVNFSEKFEGLPANISSFAQGFGQKLDSVTEKLAIQVNDARRKADKIVEEVEMALQLMEGGIKEKDEEKVVSALQAIGKYLSNNIDLDKLRKAAEGIKAEAIKISWFDPNATYIANYLSRSLKSFKGRKIWYLGKFSLANPIPTTPEGDYNRGVNFKLIAEELMRQENPFSHVDFSVETN